MPSSARRFKSRRTVRPVSAAASAPALRFSFRLDELVSRTARGHGHARRGIFAFRGISFPGCGHPAIHLAHALAFRKLRLQLHRGPAARRTPVVLAVTAGNGHLSVAHWRFDPSAADVAENPAPSLLIVVAGALFAKQHAIAATLCLLRLFLVWERSALSSLLLGSRFAVGLQRLQRPRRFGRRDSAAGEKYSARHYPWLCSRFAVCTCSRMWFTSMFCTAAGIGCVPIIWPPMWCSRWRVLAAQSG